MSIDQSTRNKLSRYNWRVHTCDDMTQQSIAVYLANKGNAYDSTGEIFYNGEKIPVFIVEFEVVEWLIKNQHQSSYSFTAYHKMGRDTSWVKWRKNIKTPLEYLSSLKSLHQKKVAKT